MLSSARAAPAPDDIEEIIGAAVASAALALMAALQEFQADGLTKKTRTAGGDCIAALYELKQATLTEIPDFEATAREHGLAALRTRCNGSFNPRTSDIMVDSVIEILGKVCADAAEMQLH